MTNTKFRKRALLSSVAMLLVALVALGSATFAWFTTNKSVTANGFTGKAASAIGLKILSESEAGESNGAKSTSNILHYGNTTTLFTGQSSKILTPVSMVPAAATISAFTTSAGSESVADRALSAAVTAVDAPANYKSGEFYVEKVYVALAGNTGDTAATRQFSFDTFTCTFSNDPIAPAARFVVMYHNPDGDTLVGKYAPSAKSTDEFVRAVSADTAVAEGDTSSVSYTAVTKPTNTFTVNSNAGDCYFTFIAFLDGQDEACTTANVRAGDVFTGVNFKLELSE